MPRPPVRVCFVCSGNICRSPTAEVVLRHIAQTTGRSELVDVDSAGTGSWHAGDDMDARSRKTLEDADYRVPPHVAKQFTPADFAERDLVVALDSGHRDILWWLAAETPDPEESRAKIVLLRTYDPTSSGEDDRDVPDPYYGRAGGFREVLAQVERSCAALLAELAIGDVAQQADSPPL